MVQCQSTHLPPMWPGFDSQTPRHKWADFIGSLLCPERFFSVYSGFPLSSKTNIWFDLIKRFPTKFLAKCQRSVLNNKELEVDFRLLVATVSLAESASNSKFLCYHDNQSEDGQQNTERFAPLHKF